MLSYIPSRSDIIFIDFEPVKAKTIGEYRPALVLSNQAYNQKTGLLICCPISTSDQYGHSLCSGFQPSLNLVLERKKSKKSSNSAAQCSQ